MSKVHTIKFKLITIKLLELRLSKIKNLNPDNNMRCWFDYHSAFTKEEAEAWGGKKRDQGHIGRKSDPGFKLRQSCSRVWALLLENAISV